MRQKTAYLSAKVELIPNMWQKNPLICQQKLECCQIFDKKLLICLQKLDCCQLCDKKIAYFAAKSRMHTANQAIVCWI